jgi:hypothetical protein
VSRVYLVGIIVACTYRTKEEAGDQEMNLRGRRMLFGLGSMLVIAHSPFICLYASFSFLGRLYRRRLI